MGRFRGSTPPGARGAQRQIAWRRPSRPSCSADRSRPARCHERPRWGITTAGSCFPLAFLERCQILPAAVFPTPALARSPGIALPPGLGGRTPAPAERLGEVGIAPQSGITLAWRARRRPPSGDLGGCASSSTRLSTNLPTADQALGEMSSPCRPREPSRARHQNERPSRRKVSTTAADLRVRPGHRASSMRLAGAGLPVVRPLSVSLLNRDSAISRKRNPSPLASSAWRDRPYHPPTASTARNDDLPSHTSTRPQPHSRMQACWQDWQLLRVDPPHRWSRRWRAAARAGRRRPGPGRDGLPAVAVIRGSGMGVVEALRQVADWAQIPAIVRAHGGTTERGTFGSAPSLRAAACEAGASPERGVHRLLEPEQPSN